ncbi:hypothetical protein [Curtobacterium sp. RRHDQ10]|uniref:hypothetical protein n=1 Tax=Curtobacterium phyllosphaerae TaxID=3413379 RepID=UPI003BF31F2D
MKTTTKTQTLAALVAIALVPLALTGCAATEDSARTDPSGGTGDSANAFTSCMREHGVPMMDAGAGDDRSMRTRLPEGVSQAQFAEAADACATKTGAGAGGSGAGDGGGAKSLDDDPGHQADLIEVAECVRGKGIADYPDPGAGEDAYRTMREPDEEVAAAERACFDEIMPGTGSGSGSRSDAGSSR